MQMTLIAVMNSGLFTSTPTKKATNLRPDGQSSMHFCANSQLKYLLHSCDRLAMDKIIERALIPSGWPSGARLLHLH